MKWLLLLSAVAIVSGGTKTSFTQNAASGKSLKGSKSAVQPVYSTSSDNLPEGVAPVGNFLTNQRQKHIIYRETQFPQMQKLDNANGGYWGRQDFPMQAFQQFDENNYEIQQEEDSQSSFSSAISGILEGSGLSGFFSGSSTMSRLMMGEMALPLMAAFPLGLGALVLMTFPILQLTLPGIRRSMEKGHFLLVNEECVERLSCNLGRKFPHDARLFSGFEGSENRWLHRVSKSLKAGEDCKRFSCSQVSKIQALLKNFFWFGKNDKIENNLCEDSPTQQYPYEGGFGPKLYIF